MTKKLPAYLQPGPPAGSGYSKEKYECSDCGYITYDGYKKETNKESLGKGFICPQCGGMEVNPLEDNPPMSARDRYASKVKSYESDNIRKKYIQEAMNSEGHEEDITEKDLLDSPDWTIAVNRGNGEIEYNEYWGEPCWQALYEKEEYKGLDGGQAIQKFMDERFSSMLKEIGVSNYYWTFENNILQVLIALPTKSRTAQREVHISKDTWSFDMENGEIKLSLGNMFDAGWFWDGDASDLNGYLVRMSTSEVRNEFITETERVGLTLQELKPYIVDSINNGSGIYEITGDNATWRFGDSEPDLNEELADVEGLTEEDKEGIKDKFWGEFGISFDDFSTDYGQIFREEFTARLEQSTTIRVYLAAIQDMRQLGAEQYEEYEMFEVGDALIKAKEEWEKSKQPDIKPLEQFGKLRINKVVITVPHAIGTGDNTWDIKKHFQDVIAQDIAEGVYSILKEEVDTQLFVSDKPRKEVDYNRPNSRTTEWRRKVDKELGESTLLVDIHSYDKGFPKFEKYDVIIFEEQGNEKLINNLMDYGFNGVKVGVYANGPDGIYYSIVKDTLTKRILAIMVEVNEHSRNMNKIISELGGAILRFVTNET